LSLSKPVGLGVIFKSEFDIFVGGMQALNGAAIDVAKHIFYLKGDV
jgi:hypothetical protein